MTNETTETTTLTAEQILKNRQAFSDYIQTHYNDIIEGIDLKGHSPLERSYLTQLTQNIEGFNCFANLPPMGQYVFWYIVNEREEVMNTISVLNAMCANGSGIFVIKAGLEDDNIVFNTVLAPEIKRKTKVKREVNKDTPAKNLQFEYWQMYANICDELGLGDLQIFPAQQHYQYITTGKGNSQLLVTLNTQKSLATVEFMNNKDLDKEAYNKLLASRIKIEKELKDLEWLELPGKSRAKSRPLLRLRTSTTVKNGKL
jgi:hypothetical protein